MGHAHNEHFDDYSPTLKYHLFGLIIIAAIYTLTPYIWPLETLHFITLALGIYCVWLYLRGEPFLAALIVFAAILNEFLVPYFSKALNLVLTVFIGIILVFVSVNITTGKVKI